MSGIEASRIFTIAHMDTFRTAMFAFAFANLFVALVAAQVSLIAESGDYRSRLILAVIHPIAAIATTVLVFISKPGDESVRSPSNLIGEDLPLALSHRD